LALNHWQLSIACQTSIYFLRSWLEAVYAIHHYQPTILAEDYPLFEASLLGLLIGLSP